jgi:putative membrane protein
VGFMRFVTWLVTNAVALAAAAWLFDGIWFNGPSHGQAEIQEKLLPLLLVALILGVVTAIVKPVLTLLSLPLVIITIGLFLVVINAFMLQLTAWLSDKVDIGFHVDGFMTALGGAVVITIVTWGVNQVIDGK